MSAAPLPAFRREAVAYPQKDPYGAVHQALMLALDGDYLAAAIVSFFTFRWQYLGRPFQCTHAEISAGTIKAASSRTVRRKLPGLVDRGFIAVTDLEGNPEGDEYTVFPEKIQDAVLAAGRRSPLRVQPNPGQMAEVNPGQMAGVSYKTNNSKKSTTTTSLQTTESVVVSPADVQNGGEHDAVQRGVSADPETQAQTNSGIETLPDPEAVQALADQGISRWGPTGALQLVRTCGAQRVFEAIRHWKQQRGVGTGMLVKFCEHGVPSPPRPGEVPTLPRPPWEGDLSFEEYCQCGGRARDIGTFGRWITQLRPPSEKQFWDYVNGDPNIRRMYDALPRRR